MLTLRIIEASKNITREIFEAHMQLIDNDFNLALGVICNVNLRLTFVF